MVQTEGKAQPAFAGKKAEKELATRLFRIFQARGRMFSESAPIRVGLAQLAEFMESQEAGEQNWAAKIDAALSASPDVFEREVTDDDVVVFVTTRAGVVPGATRERDAGHVLTERFKTPEPKRETPRSKRHLLRETVVETTSPWDAVPYAPDSWQAAIARELATQAAQQAHVYPIDQPGATVPEVDEIDDESLVVSEPVAQPVEAINLAEATDEQIADAIRGTLGRELSVAQWGDTWMAEDRVERFSRGDLRRIEDYLKEQDAPATDESIVQEVFRTRPNAPAYATTLFAVNYRLSRETREFEFVGTATHGVWALANAASPVSSKRKPAEIGQDYRFLLDYRTPPELVEEGIVEHVLTYYEYANGVLPLDANIGTIMPKPGFSDQRAARLTFESPQTFETVTAELRFPTSNRGGFVVGLEDFFATNLVPGAVLTIERTDRPTHFLLEYFQISRDDRKLLHLDERKGRYAFRSTTYYCAVQDDMLLEEDRFPKLADAKPLDERARRRPEQVVQATFERVGENRGSADAPRFRATIGDVLAAANIERPIGADLLRDILTSGTYQEFSADDSEEDTYYYQPEPVSGA